MPTILMMHLKFQTTKNTTKKAMKVEKRTFHPLRKLTRKEKSKAILSESGSDIIEAQN
jgi:hypothetical protein